MTTPFQHGKAYTTIRNSLNLGNIDGGSLFDPGSSIISLGANSDNAIKHELIHVNQLASTTSGITMTALMALRSAVVESFVSKLNSEFSSGLWVPIAGWLSDLNTGKPDDWWDPNQPYYYVSMMKRKIGIIDSMLYSIGAFESMNRRDTEYWQGRFEWSSLFEDGAWEFEFRRNPWNGGWWPYGITSLYEASAIYLELLNATGSIVATNRAIRDKIDQARAIQKNKLRSDPQFMGYFGPFMIVEEHGTLHTPDPFHLVPIAAFWALQAPLPHPKIASAVQSRGNDKNFSWPEVDPGNLLAISEFLKDLIFI